MSISIRGMKPYVPAKDFELSKRFYSTLGFQMSEGWGGTADFELNGSGFRLQNHYVKDWADNFMFVIGVDDVDAWRRRVSDMQASGEFPEMRFRVPEPVAGRSVLHVIDPAGVLLVFVQ